MLSKSVSMARMLCFGLVLTGCGSLLPWGNEKPDEVNLAITVENNLLYLPTALVNGRSGRYFFGSAASHSVIDPTFAQDMPSRRYSVQLNQKESVDLSAVVLPLSGVGDVLIGADAWREHAVTIDYRIGLLSYQKTGIHPHDMTLFDYEGEPSIVVEVNGQPVIAVVDTASPDTLILPGQPGRATARVSIAGTDLGTVDVTHAKIARARVGNRLLSKFLITIDYGKEQIGLWRDPRIPL